MAIAISHADVADGTFSDLGATEWNKAHSITGLGTNQLLYSTGATALAQSANLTFDGTTFTAASGTITADASQIVSTVTRNNAGVTFGAAWKLTITDTNSAAGSLAMQILGGASGTTNFLKIDKYGSLTLNGFVDVSAAGQGTAPNTGILSSSNRLLFYSNSAVSGAAVASVGLVVLTSDMFSWATTSDPGTRDTNFSKISAGLVGVGTGAQGSFAGSLKLSNLITTGAAISAGASTVAFGGTTQTTIGANGAASALTANPLGYITVNVGGTAAIIPYYNA